MADELTEALKELRTMFGHGVYISVEAKGIHYPEDYPGRKPLLTAYIDVGDKHFYGPALSEAMAQVRSWKAAQEEKGALEMINPRIRNTRLRGALERITKGLGESPSLEERLNRIRMACRDPLLRGPMTQLQQCALLDELEKLTRTPEQR